MTSTITRNVYRPAPDPRLTIDEAQRYLSRACHGAKPNKSLFPAKLALLVDELERYEARYI